MKSHIGQTSTQLPANLLEAYDLNAGEVLCFFPNGELKNGEWVDRGPQKGPTCWFYATKSLAWNHTESSAEQEIILNYCNAIAQVHVHHLVANEIANRIATREQISAALQQAKLIYDMGARSYLNLEFECQNIDWNKVRLLVEKYLTAKFNEGDIEQKEIDELASETIRQLENSPIFQKNEGTFSKLIRKGAEKLKSNNMLSLAEAFLDIPEESAEAILVSKYHSLIFGTLHKILGITKIAKKDEEGTDGLQANLLAHFKQFGPLLAVGTFGITYHKEKPQELADKLGTRTLYGWDRTDNELRNSNHVINVIGLKIDKKKSRNSLVVFVDPNDGSKVGGERRAYVITMQDFYLRLIRLHKCENYLVPLALFQQQAKEIWVPANVSQRQYVQCVKHKLALLQTEILDKKTWKTFFGERAEPTRNAQNILDIIGKLDDKSSVGDWIEADKQVSAVLNNMQYKTWNRSDDTQDFYEHLKKCYEGEFAQQEQDNSVTLPGYAEDCHLQKRLREMREIYKTESGWKTHLSAMQELIHKVKQSSKIQARTEGFSKARFKDHVALLENELVREINALCRPTEGYCGLFARKTRTVNEVIVYLNNDMNKAQISGGRMHDNYVRLLATTLREVYQLHKTSFEKKYFDDKAGVKQIVEGIQGSNRYKFETPSVRIRIG